MGYHRLEEVDSYAPGHQIRFGSLNYIADIRGDLIFEGFTASAAAPHPHEGGPSDLLSNPVQGPSLIPASALDPGRTTSSEDGRINPTGLSPITELPSRDPEVTMLSTGSESNMTLPVTGKPDSSLDVTPYS